jgi:hypothetical protein
VDLRRLRAGEVIAGFSGVVLVVALFLPWYTHDVATSFGPRPSLPSQNAFQAMAVADLLLLIVAVAAVGLAVTTAAEKTVAVPIAYASLLAVAAVVAVVIVLFHFGDTPAPSPPPPRALRSSVQTDEAIGIWLAWVASVGVFLGSLLAMRDERLSRGGRPTDQTGKPVAHVPEVERLASP